MKRLFDIIISVLGLVLSLPVMLPVMVLVWLQDFHSPFYLAKRVGRNGKLFTMIKLRSMVVNADKTGVDSTSSTDSRITSVGRFIRKFKLDELSQLMNVLTGDMSFVGPRPNVKRETDLYTEEEKRLLTVRPGITDFASIVFSDEGEILADKQDPDLAYNQLIRPGKSRLGLFYIDKRSLWLDVRLMWLTAVAIVSREKALERLVKTLERLGADSELIEIAKRDRPLRPAPPPGSDRIVASRKISGA